ncbi:MAG: hypothetical protein Q9199_001423 [Rusavskia elegans]
MHLPYIPILISLLLTSPAVAGHGKHLGVHRDTKCYTNTQNHMFPSNDFVELYTDLVTNNPQELTFLRHHSAINHKWGLLLVCVQNKFLQIYDTRVRRVEIGNALKRIYDKCCQDKTACAGGYAQGKGDDELFVDVVTKTFREDCSKWGWFG